jgi:hypothetical protein
MPTFHVIAQIDGHQPVGTSTRRRSMALGSGVGPDYPATLNSRRYHLANAYRETAGHVTLKRCSNRSRRTTSAPTTLRRSLAVGAPARVPACKLAEGHCQLRVEADRLYIADGPIVTSAGSAAVIDLCLHLMALLNLGRPLTVDALAARASMSARTFAHRFRQRTGTTPAPSPRSRPAADSAAPIPCDATSSRPGESPPASTAAPSA